MRCERLQEEADVCLLRVVHSRFRLFISDNDYLSYVDVSLDTALVEPVVFVTNPPVSSPHPFNIEFAALFRVSEHWCVLLNAVHPCICV